MQKRYMFLFILLLWALFFCSAEEAAADSQSPFSMSVKVGYDLPIAGSTGFFEYGLSANLNGFLTPKPVPFLGFGANLGYSMFRQTSQSFLSTIYGGGCLQLKATFFPWFGGYIHAEGGAAFSVMEIQETVYSGLGGYYAGGAGLLFLLGDIPRVRLEGLFKSIPGVYNGIHISLGGEIQFQKRPKIKEAPIYTGPRPTPLIDSSIIEDYISWDVVEFEQVFPVFYKHYDDHPLGSVVLRNKSDTAIEDLSVSIFVQKYMDFPKECAASLVLEPGETKEVELFALFNKDVLSINEATKVAANISASFRAEGEKVTTETVKTLRMYNSNALIWDDDRKAAAFVSAKDPVILKLVKNITGLNAQYKTIDIDKNLIKALLIFQTLSHMGLTYHPDPITPYKELATVRNDVDLVQFPRQTLQYSSGDCDDLSVLYCACLESSAIETAFITVPGHIYTAFALSEPVEVVRGKYSSLDNFIFINEKAWVPVEITMLDKGFLASWVEGAKEWREYQPHDQAGFYPLHNAWETYEPVAMSGNIEGISITDTDTLNRTIAKEYERFAEQEVYHAVARIKERIEKHGDNPKLRNSLGVLYAKYGLYDKAEKQFLVALHQYNNDYMPALVNLGNLYYLKSEFDKALLYYQSAYEKHPDNATLVLAMTRTHHELEEYTQAQTKYDELKDLHPGLAERFAYLDFRGDDAVRSASAGTVEDIIFWEEEE